MSPAPRVRRVHVTPSTGNVFEDLGFPRDEARHLLIRADLMIALERFIRAEGITQKEAAAMLCVTQPRISDLVRGKIDLFTIDSLVEMCDRAGLVVKVQIRASETGPPRRIRGRRRG